MKEDEVGRHVAHMEIVNVYKSLIPETKSKKLPDRHRGRQEDNIKKDLDEIGCEGTEFVHLALAGSGNTASGFKIGREFFEHLSVYQLLKKNCVE
jgi:hypothetical protein